MDSPFGRIHKNGYGGPPSFVETSRRDRAAEHIAKLVQLCIRYVCRCKIVDAIKRTGIICRPWSGIGHGVAGGTDSMTFYKSCLTLALHSSWLAHGGTLCKSVCSTVCHISITFCVLHLFRFWIILPSACFDGISNITAHTPQMQSNMSPTCFEGPRGRKIGLRRGGSWLGRGGTLCKRCLFHGLPHAPTQPVPPHASCQLAESLPACTPFPSTSLVRPTVDGII